MELTRSKLNKIIKKYKAKLEQHDKEWLDICSKKCTKKFNGDKIILTGPSIFDHERHNSKGATLFKDLMKEFEGIDI